MHTIGLLGGTFNPVHFGHLRIALECKENLALDELRMVPCANPPHREMPEVSAEQRLAMLKLAMQDCADMVVDDRELKRPGESYTIDTLRSIRKEFPESSLNLIIGSDAFQALSTWHEWQQLLEYAHLIIAKRPDNIDDKASDVGEQLRSCFVENYQKLHEQTAGLIYVMHVSQLEISSTEIRSLFQNQKSAQFLLPEAVIHYIKQNFLYTKDQEKYAN